MWWCCPFGISANVPIGVAVVVVAAVADANDGNRIVVVSGANPSVDATTVTSNATATDSDCLQSKRL